VIRFFVANKNFKVNLMYKIRLHVYEHAFSDSDPEKTLFEVN